MNSAPCHILEWDSEFFGFNIARIERSLLNPQMWEQISAFCQANQVKCLYCFSSPNDKEGLEIVRQEQFLWVDFRMTLDLKLNKSPQLPITSKIAIREAREEDLPELETIASASHTDSRFFFDPSFPDHLCKEMYTIWIRKSVEGSVEKVFVPEIDGKASGYITCKIDSDTKERKGIIDLVGVSKKVRGKGVGSQLVQHALSFFMDQQINHIEVVTQGRNLGAQRLYQKHGFKTSNIELTFHKWFS